MLRLQLHIAADLYVSNGQEGRRSVVYKAESSQQCKSLSIGTLYTIAQPADWQMVTQQAEQMHPTPTREAMTQRVEGCLPLLTCFPSVQLRELSSRMLEMIGQHVLRTPHSLLCTQLLT